MFSNPKSIIGKWHGHSYEVIEELGRGANGVVYLACLEDTPYAIKVGEDAFSLTSEVNVLKHVKKAQGIALGPSIHDVDDWQEGSEIRPFYVMNVIKGDPLLHFVTTRGNEWVPVLLIQLLSVLEELHGLGWVFGDLKPDNLKVTGSPPKIAWFDAGGMTKTGRAIKEYTEAYDRGHWKMGDRKAEPEYDLFSLAMIFLYLHYGYSLTPEKEPHNQLHRYIFSEPALSPYQKVLWKALKGTYSSAAEMKKEMMQAWYTKKGGQLESQTNASHASSRNRQTKVEKQGHKGKAISFFFISSFIIFLFALYLFSQTL